MGVATRSLGRAGRVPGRAQTIVVMAIVTLAIGGLTWCAVAGILR